MALCFALGACAPGSESPADVAVAASDASGLPSTDHLHDAGAGLDASATDASPSSADAMPREGDGSTTDALATRGPCLERALEACPAPGIDWFGLYIGYIVQPTPEGAVEQVSLRVVKRHPYALSRDANNTGNQTVFDVVSTPSIATSEVLAFETKPPVAVRSEAIPDELVYEAFSAFGAGCATVGGELSGVAGRILRDKSGALLAATGGLWLRTGGMLEAPGLARMPFGLTWESADCQPCGASQWRGAALLLRLPEAAPIRLLPGEQTTLRFGGRAYVFRAGWTKQRDREPCGEGGWSLDRRDLLTGLHEDGGVYPLP